MTYKSESSTARNSFIPFLLGKNADFVLNGHAHQYRRTHILDKDGKVAEKTGTSGTRIKTSATDKGIVHIVNGRGGVFSSDATGSSWAGNAFAPTYSKQEGLVTLMEFAGDSVSIKTISIGDDSKQGGVVDTWTWTRGSSPTAAPAIDKPAYQQGLLRVFPNPTRDNITLKSAHPGRVSIHRLNGRELASFNLAAGKSETWRAVDHNGKKLSPGIYIAKLRFAQEQQQREFVLLP
jgi:hypothetical protein